MPELLDYIVVAMLGAAVGGAELVSRYRDAPQTALTTKPALLYILLNLVASVIALAFVRAFNWTFGASGPNLRWTQVLVAGIGAVALFRTSLFTVRAGDRDIGVGPGSFLQTLREAADREVDRVRAHSRGATVARLMQDVDFEKAVQILVPYCLALMQNVSDDEQKKLSNAVKTLTDDRTEGRIKIRMLGLHLLNVVGPAVLTAAVETLRAELADGATPPPDSK